MIWKRQVLPVTDIYCNLKTETYTVQPFTEGPVATTAFGDRTVINREDFAQKIVEAVVANLEKFGKEKYDQNRAVRLTSHEQREFIKGHLGVGITKDPAGRLIVRPLHREHGGFVTVDDDAIILEPEEIRHRLASAIAMAFRKAT